jgi:hypothetical protein
MIENGCLVTFKPEYGDASEVFTVSQWDGCTGWAGDESGRGWYFTSNQVNVLLVEDEWEDEE